MNNKNIAVFFLILIIISGCNNFKDNIDEINTGTMINISEIKMLQGKSVYFGHQSVGFNMIGGLNSLIGKNKDLNFIKIITLNEFFKLSIPDNDSSFYIIHSIIGQNDYPDSKLDDFKNKLDTLQNIDAAFMKLCFVDFNSSTDVESLYSKYIETYTGLEQRYTETRFVFFTVPLTIKRNLFVRLAKRILNRPDVSYKRNHFNELIRGTRNINFFDIAYLESHLENNAGKIEDEYLLKVYASDAGHLNLTGSEKVAGQLLIYLNNLFMEEQSR